MSIKKDHRKIRDELDQSNTKTRFFSKIEKTDGCWIWKAAIDPSGYGVFMIRADKMRAKLGSHRVSYYYHFGIWPRGLNTCHRCDTPSCTNPDHLFLGTQKENIQDCISKKRNSCGSKNVRAKIVEEDVPLIVDMFNDGYCVEKLSEKFGISVSVVYSILCGRTWKHVVRDKKIRNGNIDKISIWGKLCENDILKILQMIKEGKSQRYIADVFNVHQNTISNINRG